MEALYSNFFDYILHFDRYLPLVMEQYGHWIYAILFTIVFCETGLVVTPFLPGDSLLFACGALAATAGGLDLTTLVIIFLVSAILGDACNYMIAKNSGTGSCGIIRNSSNHSISRRLKPFMPNMAIKRSSWPALPLSSVRWRLS